MSYKKECNVKRVAEYRWLPFVSIDMIVEYHRDGEIRRGRIIDAGGGCNFAVKMDDKKHSGMYHPYSLKYFDWCNNVLADFTIERSQEQLNEYLQQLTGHKPHTGVDCYGRR